MKMKKLHTLKTVLKATRADKIIFGFVMFVLIAALVIWLVEPNIPHYLDALWYCYTVFSTVGFGDFVDYVQHGNKKDFLGRAENQAICVGKKRERRRGSAYACGYGTLYQWHY